MENNTAMTDYSIELVPDFKMAEQYLTRLDEEAASFCFHAYDDNKIRKEKLVRQAIHGELGDVKGQLKNDNLAGMAIGVAINAMKPDLPRKEQNAERVRCVVVEDDEIHDEPRRDWPIEPHMIVESSPGKYHYYFMVDDLSFDEYVGVQQYLIETYGSDAAVKLPQQLMRLPGFWHQKVTPANPEPTPFMTRIVDYDNAEPAYSREDILKAFPPIITTARKVRHALPDDMAEDAENDPILAALYHNDLVQERREGKYDITCPWVSEHTGGADDGTAYFPSGTNDHLFPNFKCLHAHCADRHIGTLTEQLGVSLSEYKLKLCLQLFGTMDNGLLKEYWQLILSDAQLKPTHLTEAKEHLVELGVGAKRDINDEFKAHVQQVREKIKTRKRQQRLAKIQGERKKIIYNKSRPEEMLEWAEQAMLDNGGKYPLLRLDQLYVRVHRRAPKGMHALDDAEAAAPTIPLFTPYDETSMSFRMGHSVLWTKCYEKNNEVIEEDIAAPDRVIRDALKNPTPLAPEVTGLVTHPIILPDGRLVVDEGHDEQSGLWLDYGGASFTIPGHSTQQDAKDAAASILGDDGLFAEVAFKGDLDRSVGISTLLNGMARKALSQAPGTVFNAHVHGTGKSTVARLISVTLCGYDIGVATLESGEEGRKAMVTHLVEQPPILCYDNVEDGEMISSTILAKVLSEPKYKGRKLGVNENIHVNTNVLVVLTGNNLTANAQLTRRLMFCMLDTELESPEKRTFKHANVILRALSLRRRTIKAMLTIQRAYFDAGCPDVGVRASGFPDWDKAVRFPLIYAGMTDPAIAFDRAKKESPDYLGKIAMMTVLKEKYGGDEFTAGDVHKAVHGTEECNLSVVFDEYYPGSYRNARSVGKMLTTMLDRPMEGHVLRRRPKDGISRYYIERVR